jgi:hypothetical protein
VRGERKKERRKNFLAWGWGLLLKGNPLKAWSSLQRSS